LIPLAFQLIKDFSAWDAFAKAELKKNQSNKKGKLFPVTFFSLS
jgi:hypothetical protein